MREHSTPSKSIDPAAAYWRALRHSPLLEAEEEAELVCRAREDGDQAARKRLVESHLRLVVKTAAQFRGYGMAMEDLIAEGNYGLVRALEGFDPSKGLRFSTYAQWWIKAAMFEHVLKFSTAVTFGLSSERKKLFFKLRGAKAKVMGGQSGTLDAAQAAEVGRDLGVRDERVIEMERLLLQAPRSLDAPVVEGGPSFGALLADDAPDAETICADRQQLMYRRELLKAAWGGLTERERDIVAERTLRERPLRLEDLALRYGISRERVRQIEAAAMRKLKELVRAAEQRLVPGRRVTA